MEPLAIPVRTARRLALRSQQLHHAGHPGISAASTRTVIEQLGYVQIDTIAVVERAHHHILSPFDSLVINRRWLETMFGFQYRIECYVPAPKRQFGYFTLPLLHGDRFIGRLDAKAHRRDGLLQVHRIWFESDARDIADRASDIADLLRRFAAFNGCSSVRLDATTPAGVLDPLSRFVG